jgi:hypothetical protein
MYGENMRALNAAHKETITAIREAFPGSTKIVDVAGTRYKVENKNVQPNVRETTKVKRLADDGGGETASTRTIPRRSASPLRARPGCASGSRTREPEETRRGLCGYGIELQKGSSVHAALYGSSAVREAEQSPRQTFCSHATYAAPRARRTHSPGRNPRRIRQMQGTG